MNERSDSSEAPMGCSPFFGPLRMRAHSRTVIFSNYQVCRLSLLVRRSQAELNSRGVA
jgi:hypothetical protein